MTIAMILTSDGLGFAWWQYGIAYFGDLVLVALWKGNSQ